ERGNILLDERPHLRRIEGSDEVEGEVARVAEPFPIDLVGALEVELVEDFGGERLGARMVPVDDGTKGIPEGNVGVRGAIHQGRPRLLLIGEEGSRIYAGRRELEMDELKQRLQIL